jgi:hypothetical protein
MEGGTVSYSEENGQVVLRMTREDYGIVMRALGSFTAPIAAPALFTNKNRDALDQVLSLVNRLNEGNPHYTPYQVEAKK